jgi:hypothetical protein
MILDIPARDGGGAGRPGPVDGVGQAAQRRRSGVRDSGRGQRSGPMSGGPRMGMCLVEADAFEADDGGPEDGWVDHGGVTPMLVDGRGWLASTFPPGWSRVQHRMALDHHHGCVNATGPIRDADLDIRSLRAFVAVAEELSFTRAAERLSVAQQAISRDIRRLEERLGVRLPGAHDASGDPDPGRRAAAGAGQGAHRAP